MATWCTGGVALAQTVGERAVRDEREHDFGRVVSQPAPIAAGEAIARRAANAVLKDVWEQHVRNRVPVGDRIISCPMRSDNTGDQAGEQFSIIRPVVIRMR